jgi:hypothetical protein
MPFDSCDRALRMPDAFPPLGVRGSNGPNSVPPSLGPFSRRTLGI